MNGLDLIFCISVIGFGQHRVTITSKAVTELVGLEMLSIPTTLSPSSPRPPTSHTP